MLVGTFSYSSLTSLAVNMQKSEGTECMVFPFFANKDVLESDSPSKKIPKHPSTIKGTMAYEMAFGTLV